jgi:hypothetical protein
MWDTLREFLRRDPKTTVGGIVSIISGGGYAYKAILEWNMDHLTVGITSIVIGLALLAAGDSKQQVPAYQLRSTDKVEVDRKAE